MGGYRFPSRNTLFLGVFKLQVKLYTRCRVHIHVIRTTYNRNLALAPHYSPRIRLNLAPEALVWSPKHTGKIVSYPCIVNVRTKRPQEKRLIAIIVFAKRPKRCRFERRFERYPFYFLFNRKFRRSPCGVDASGDSIYRNRVCSENAFG